MWLRPSSTPSLLCLDKFDFRSVRTGCCWAGKRGWSSELDGQAAASLQHGAGHVSELVVSLTLVGCEVPTFFSEVWMELGVSLGRT